MSEKTLAAVCGGRNERAGGTSLAERRVAIDGETVRTWRMREDPFADVWQSEVVPQLVADAGRDSHPLGNGALSRRTE